VNAIDVAPYTHDDQAITTPAVAPLSTVPLKSMAPAAPAENDVIVVSRRRRWVTLAVFAGAFGIVGTAFAIVYTVGFVESAQGIDEAWNAFGVLCGPAFLGACAGAVGMWAWMVRR
jgi:hypothetical protein